jgi:hypothetical protein
MSWQEHLAKKTVKPHVTSLAEINQLRAVVLRDITDGRVSEISADRRFACLYSAALQLAHMVIACCGYRVPTRAGHHQITFEVLPLAPGAAFQDYAEYFDVCRQKRNLVEYDGVLLASETEVEHLLLEVSSFQTDVEDWIKSQHPDFARRGP